mmetsp:Transcript_39934/g.99935  ORF Transcript_39934/g.99935 Transcript_39934/m.99935 type:complete len:229 (+) Transcript_39934:1785-2471(+)
MAPLRHENATMTNAMEMWTARGSGAIGVSATISARRCGRSTSPARPRARATPATMKTRTRRRERAPNQPANLKTPTVLAAGASGASVAPTAHGLACTRSRRMPSARVSSAPTKTGTRRSRNATMTTARSPWIASMSGATGAIVTRSASRSGHSRSRRSRRARARTARDQMASRKDANAKTTNALLTARVSGQSGVSAATSARRSGSMRCSTRPRATARHAHSTTEMSR